MQVELDKVLDNLFNQPVNIIEEPWHYLSPFSAHEIEIWGETFKTHEHAYQSKRFKDSVERNEIKNAKSPLQAWMFAQKYKSSENFIKYSREELEEITTELFQAKAAQHLEIQAILKRLKGRGILKIFGTDSNWGTGKDGAGKNFMGKLWMEIAEEY